MRIGDVFLIPDQKPTTGPGPPARSRIDPGNIEGLRLAVGQLLKARVIETNPDGKSLLSMAGRTIPVRSEVTLKPGQEVWLEVRELLPSPRLSIAGAKGAVHDLLRQLLSEGPGIARAAILLGNLPGREDDLLSRLFSQTPLLNDLLTGQQGEEADLGSLVRLLAALKNLANKLPASGPGSTRAVPPSSLFSATIVAGEAPDDGAATIEKLRAGLAPLRTFAEGCAGLNACSAETGGLPFLLFPCLFAANSGWGAWFFQQDETADQKTAGSRYRLDFFLNMSRLGPLQIRISADRDRLQGVFLVEDRPAQAHLTAALPELETILRGLGFVAVNLACRPAQIGLQQAIRETIGRAAGLGSTGLLDITA